MVPAHSFQIDIDSSVVKGDFYGHTCTDPLLMLHGGGRANKNRFSSMRRSLYEKGISSVAFDFSGCGDSTGIRARSSLESQVTEACRVVETLALNKPVSIMGASMGAYVAVKLLSVYPVSTLILMVPAMYAATAYTVPFAGGFTQIIRKPESWADSDAWELLSKFEGNLILVTAELDDVIPQDVIRRIIRSASRARTKKIITVPGAPHRLLNYLDTVRKTYSSKITNAIAAEMKNNVSGI